MIYVVGSSKNIFPELDNGREKFLVDMPHEGENIDNLNPWYCELTALYYLWKNCSDDIVGLEHYRRFFAHDSKPATRVTLDEARNTLSTYDIMLTTFRHKPNYSAYKWFNEAGKGDSLHTFYNVLNRVSAGLGDALYQYMNRRELKQCNMFIARKPIIDEYCSWLFPLLAEFDRTEGLGDGNKRIDGYLGEHIFGMWVELRKLNVYETTKLEMHFMKLSGAAK